MLATLMDLRVKWLKLFMIVHLSLFSAVTEAVIESDKSEGFFGGPTFFLILAFIAFLVLVIVGVLFIIFRRRNLKLRNLTSLDEEKLQSNPIFQQATNYYVNPKLLGWEVPRCRMEFIKELGQGNG